MVDILFVPIVLSSVESKGMHRSKGFLRVERTSLGALLVHDTVTTLFATDGLLGLNFVFGAAFSADVGHGGSWGLWCGGLGGVVVHGVMVRLLSEVC